MLLKCQINRNTKKDFCILQNVFVLILDFNSISSHFNSINSSQWHLEAAPTEFEFINKVVVLQLTILRVLGVIRGHQKGNNVFDRNFKLLAFIWKSERHSFAILNFEFIRGHLRSPGVQKCIPWNFLDCLGD